MILGYKIFFILLLSIIAFINIEIRDVIEFIILFLRQEVI